jgi:hypothetical protein
MIPAVDSHVLVANMPVQEVVSLGKRLTGERPLQLEEIYPVPLFETSLRHIATKYTSPSMIQLKQCLR